MKNKYRNLFLLFGVVAVLIMILTFDMDYRELWANLRRAGVYLPLIFLLWLFVYLINTLSWHVIIGSGGKPKVPFLRLFKYTVTGFALNYVTPVGLMGGEPYRVMELKPYIGLERATSSVILYVMTHIFSHFCFWISSVLLYVCLYSVGPAMGIVLGGITVFCLLLGLLLLKGYRHGMAVALTRLGGRIPFLKKKAVRFAGSHRVQLENIDRQIALLHKQNKRSFYGALLLEYVTRVLSCLEIWLILNVLTTDVSFLNCILIAAFSSLLANLLFFLPMQLGGREGGFALAVSGLSLSGAYGVYAALITRVRELFWIVVGLALMKVGNKEE
ncbi:lysylphosphatidylglycerol synthase transmembrane domain-containing protein [Bacteroides pyogenes]|uniref:Flippase-like domain-containing protein n=1 Tax=Bacteroides pyogenes TaxID=310300 RepID=A0A5D3FID7_9BACE|nr:lysylphosphatidylglycerol synthase transmembrane domain-containing protein [Bacteroides pyogenes]TYK33548.1 flippase-like domain-containing protein [Bacteroides pyogenes]TYK48677.1 flippase-like domain-containing protein [Bacteroides pyogenes]